MTNRNPFAKLLQEPITFSDGRGEVSILYESETTVLKRSSSKKGVFRGLHRQIGPSEKTKLIRVISGRIIDFVTDPGDEGEVIWYTELDSKDDWVKIESHLAHGFYAVEDVVFEYFCDGKYDESLEQSYRIDEIVSEVLGIQPIYFSAKDLNGQSFGKSLILYNGRT